MRFSAFCSPLSGVTCVLHSVCQSCTFTSHSLYAEGTKFSGSSCGSPLHFHLGTYISVLTAGVGTKYSQRDGLDLALKVAVTPSHSPDAILANWRRLLLVLGLASDVEGSADTVAAQWDLWPDLVEEALHFHVLDLLLDWQVLCGTGIR